MIFVGLINGWIVSGAYLREKLWKQATRIWDQCQGRYCTSVVDFRVWWTKWRSVEWVTCKDKETERELLINIWYRSNRRSRRNRLPRPKPQSNRRWQRQTKTCPTNPITNGWLDSFEQLIWSLLVLHPHKQPQNSWILWLYQTLPTPQIPISSIGTMDPSFHRPCLPWEFSGPKSLQIMGISPHKGWRILVVPHVQISLLIVICPWLALKTYMCITTR